MQTISPPSIDNHTHPRPIVQPNATWDDYLSWRDNNDINKIAFHQVNPHQSWLSIDLENEGPNHARFADLLTMVFFNWAFIHPEVSFDSCGRCLIERPNTHACAPDLVLYKGSRDRLPNLVGEISDTSLSFDLDEQKHLYASLGIPEYWVIATKSAQVFAFTLSASGHYEPCETSIVLPGLPISLLEQTLDRLDDSTNTAAANWFMQQLQQSPQA
jgi:Uma2 family endonuclease